MKIFGFGSCKKKKLRLVEFGLGVFFPNQFQPKFLVERFPTGDGFLAICGLGGGKVQRVAGWPGSPFPLSCV